MPSRRDEWHRGRAKDELHYCVICQRYLSPVAWSEHEHNPEAKAGAAPPGALDFLEGLTTDVVYLGGSKVTRCSSVLVVQGVEVFRLRDRDAENHIRIDLDLRGPQGKRLATIVNNQTKLLAEGYRFEDDGSSCAVVDAATGDPVLLAESLNSKTVQLLGELWVDNVRVVLTEESVKIGDASVPAGAARGHGTAILLRKNSPEIGFAKK